MSDTPRTDRSRLDEHDPYEAMAHECGKMERELAAANERIRRLIDAGDAMAPMLTCDYRSDDAFQNWTQAKEAKP